MKKFIYQALTLLGLINLHANAATNANTFYESDKRMQIVASSDGVNTYIQAEPGLIIQGATADGDRLIVPGSPSTIQGQMVGRPVTFSLHSPQSVQVAALSSSTNAESIALKARVLELELEAKESTLAAKNKALMVAGAPKQVAATVASSASVGDPSSAAPLQTAAANTDSVAKAYPVASAVAVEAQTWIVNPSNNNLRQLFNAWAKVANWTSFWEIDSDIPINAKDSVSGDFKTAVRYVLSSTELSDTPLKPCFYTNSVVRVVSKTTKCDPSE